MSTCYNLPVYMSWCLVFRFYPCKLRGFRVYTEFPKKALCFSHFLDLSLCTQAKGKMVGSKVFVMLVQKTVTQKKLISDG